MHFIIKPDGLHKLRSIDAQIRDSFFTLNGVYQVPNWTQLARDIYKTQIDNNQDFARASEVYFELSQALYGNECILYQLGPIKSPTIADLENLGVLKQKIRNSIGTIHDQGLALLVNTNLMPNVQKQGIPGQIEISGREILPFDSNGNWVYFFFKYVHSCDPCVQQYAKEHNALIDRGILKKELSKERFNKIISNGIFSD